MGALRVVMPHECERHAVCCTVECVSQNCGPRKAPKIEEEISCGNGHPFVRCRATSRKRNAERRTRRPCACGWCGVQARCSSVGAGLQDKACMFSFDWRTTCTSSWSLLPVLYLIYLCQISTRTQTDTPVHTVSTVRPTSSTCMGPYYTT